VRRHRNPCGVDRVRLPPNVPRFEGTAAVATSPTADGVEVMLGLRSVLLSVQDTRRLADYLLEAADLVQLGQVGRRTGE
jgi:hypothetical protein